VFRLLGAPNAQLGEGRGRQGHPARLAAFRVGNLHPTFGRFDRCRGNSELPMLGVELRPIREALDKLKPARPPAEPTKIYAPPRGTAKQRRGMDPRS
jgi:hypothetical protein